ncbi:unnamed protein product, partial [Musa acuminata var. zebrina]
MRPPVAAIIPQITTYIVILPSNFFAPPGPAFDITIAGILSFLSRLQYCTWFTQKTKCKIVRRGEEKRKTEDGDA